MCGSSLYTGRRERLRAAIGIVEGRFTMEETDEGARITSAGTASHAMQPQEGFNAATHLLALLFEVFTQEQIGHSSGLLTKTYWGRTGWLAHGITHRTQNPVPLTLNLGLVHADASLCTAAIDIRYPVTTDGSAIIEDDSENGTGRGCVLRRRRAYETAVPAGGPSVYRTFAKGI